MNFKLILLCLALGSQSSLARAESVAEPEEPETNEITEPQESSTHAETTTHSDNYAEIVPKALKVVQAGFSNELKFTTVKEARRFVKYGRLLPSYVSAMEADDYENKGLIGEVRKVMEDPKFKVVEQITRKTMNKYRPLDRDGYKRDDEAKYSASKYLHSLYLLASLKKKMNKDAAVKQLLERVYELKRPAMVENLLDYATPDTRTVLRLSEEEEGNKKLGCEIEVMHPVCDLLGVRKDRPEFPDGNELLKMKELKPDELKERLKAKDVSSYLIGHVCAGVRRKFRNISMIQRYEKAGVFSEGELATRLKLDTELNFYYQLYDFCGAHITW